MIGKHEEEKKEQLVQDRDSHIHTSHGGNHRYENTTGILTACGNYPSIVIFFCSHQLELYIPLFYSLYTI